MRNPEANVIDLEPPFWETHRGLIIAGILAFVVVVFGIAYWQWQRAAAEEQAYADIGNAPDDAAKLAAIQKYMGTEAAALALPTLASSQYAKKDFDGALKSYDLFAVNYPKHPLRNSVRIGVAFVKEAQGKADDAIATFLDAGNVTPTDAFNSLGLFEAARLYEEQKKPQERRKTLEQCASRFAGTLYGDRAGALIKGLDAEKAAESATPAPAAAAPVVAPAPTATNTAVAPAPVASSTAVAPAPVASETPATNAPSTTTNKASKPKQKSK